MELVCKIDTFGRIFDTINVPCTLMPATTDKIGDFLTRNSTSVSATPMTFNDNSTECNGCEKPDGQCCHSMPSLAQIANQLAHVEGPESVASDSHQPKRPEVVFIEEQQPVQTVSTTTHIELEIRNSNYEYLNHIEETQSPAEPSSSTHFTIDPFAHEVNGQVPAMPTLPVIDEQKLTDQVIARQSSGDHHAWRLMAARPEERETKDENDLVESENPENRRGDQPSSSWLETEIIAASKSPNDSEDCFYAQPGQVISVDGNQGFDHIDLRSYSIDDATFQPGTILLHTNTDPTLLAEDESAPQPITIRHRGIEFAVFSGDVSVDL